MTQNIFDLLKPHIIEPSPAECVRRGRPSFGGENMSRREYKQRAAEKARADKLSNIAILDMETDPFDKEKQTAVKPFLAVLYRDDAEPVIIWEENNEAFVERVIQAIENLPGKFTIYAHNGGKFDYMFLLHRMRGFVSFKGRGLMAAKIGRHEIRDSFHIIPERLANIQKDKFAYEKNYKNVRHKYKDEIIRYCINDCIYLLDVVKKFVAEFGLKLSIGQAAVAELRKSYKVARLGENSDAFLRNYYFGGRTECLQGRGLFTSEMPGHTPYKLFDINSAYPDAMANCQHPIGNQFTVRKGAPNAQTVFIELECRNFGALVKRGEDGEISADFDYGVFRTTIWEYQAAIDLHLIEAVKIKWCIDFAERSDFSLFVMPRYEHRQIGKKHLKTLQEGTPAYFEAIKDDIFDKLVLNNSYGKFAQNPRRFKECYITDPGEIPAIEDCSSAVQQLASLKPEHAQQAIMQEWGRLPAMECDRYWVWERPTQHMRFNNVATAASITGAVRATLLRAIALADDPIYCDTDSLICRGLNGVEIHNENLGAWKLERELDEILVAGKKLYAYKVAGVPDGHKDRIKVRSKGVQDATWRDLERIVDDDIIEFTNNAPTFGKMKSAMLMTDHDYSSKRVYMKRNVRATVARQTSRVVKRQRSMKRASA
jgi:DNA polymerase elongation subunit (family B)